MNTRIDTQFCDQADHVLARHADETISDEAIDRIATAAAQGEAAMQRDKVLRIIDTLADEQLAPGDLPGFAPDNPEDLRVICRLAANLVTLAASAPEMVLGRYAEDMQAVANAQALGGAA